MADWSPPVARRNITVRDGADITLNAVFRDPATQAPLPPPDGTTAYFRIGADAAPDVPAVIVGAALSAHVEATAAADWPDGATFRLYVVLPGTPGGDPRVIVEGEVIRVDAA